MHAEEADGSVVETQAPGFKNHVLIAAGMASVWIILPLVFWWIYRDDGFIYFRYAANLRSGVGPVFNPGEYVEGVTSPLWLMILGLADHFAPAHVSCKPVGVVCVLFAAALVVRWTIQAFRTQDGMIRQGLLTAVLVGLAALLLDFSITYYSVAGLETPLSLLVVTWGAYLLFRECCGAPSRFTGLVLGLAVWVRPEGVLMSILGVALLGTVLPRGRLVRQAATAFLVVGSLFLTRWVLYGALLPNTYHAKASLSLQGALQAMRYLSPLAYHWAKPVVLILVVGGLELVLRRYGSRAALAALLPLIVELAMVVVAGGDWMPFLRFLVPAYGALAVLCGLGAANLAGALHGRMPRITMVAALLVLLVAGGLWPAYRSQDSFGPCWRDRHFWIRYEDRLVTPAAKWIQQNVASGSLVAFGDMGAAPYLNRDVRFLDYYGLVTKEVATLEDVERSCAGVKAHELDPNGPLSALIRRKRPDFVLTRVREGHLHVGTRFLGGDYEVIDAIHYRDGMYVSVLQRVVP